MIVVLKDIKLLPPRPNEMLLGVKANKLGAISCVKYTTATPRVSLDGIRAVLGQVKFIPPRETPKRPALPLEREEKRPRTVDALNKKIELETIVRKKLEKHIKILSNYVRKKRES
jgi:hypothetical protein